MRNPHGYCIMSDEERWRMPRPYIELQKDAEEAVGLLKSKVQLLRWNPETSKFGFTDAEPAAANKALR